jgi:hypothetical protein
MNNGTDLNDLQRRELELYEMNRKMDEENLRIQDRLKNMDGNIYFPASCSRTKTDEFSWDTEH